MKISQQLEISEEMQRRINFLRKHNKYSGLPIGTREDNCPIKRNCYGTASYLLGLEKEVKALWVEAGNKLNDPSSDEGEFIFHQEDNLPDYVGPKAMLLLLRNMKKTIKLPGAIVTYSYEDPTEEEEHEFAMRHAGVYILTDNWRDIIFEQNGRGGKWQYKFQDDCILSIGRDKSIQRRTLQIEYFLPRVQD